MLEPGRGEENLPLKRIKKTASGKKLVFESELQQLENFDKHVKKLTKLIQSGVLDCNDLSFLVPARFGALLEVLEKRGLQGVQFGNCKLSKSKLKQIL